jgi:methylenetetrahydrofolate dehydrogenase (NADP+)/methenyltetrahydrofolate cyclohydrolase
MNRIDGRAIAAEIGERVGADAAALRERGVEPALAVVVPTKDPSAASYVRVLDRAAQRVGVTTVVHTLADATAAEELPTLLDGLSADPAVHGIVVQTPLPGGWTAAEIGQRVAPAKDVDGMNPLSAGRVALGLPAYAPATAAAVLEILRHTGTELRGRRAVVIGRSPVVGKPAALLLLAEDATVTVCHSRTVDLAAVARTAEILVVAIGRPRFVGPDFVAPGATVIDVGTTWVDSEDGSGGGMVGDVDGDAVAGHAGALTPVPGGVGPVTTMVLLRNTVAAAGA